MLYWIAGSKDSAITLVFTMPERPVIVSFLSAGALVCILPCIAFAVPEPAQALDVPLRAVFFFSFGLFCLSAIFFVQTGIVCPRRLLFDDAWGVADRAGRARMYVRPRR